MDFAFHGIHATFLNTNSYVYDEHHGSEKTFGWIQTYDLENSTTNWVNVNFSKLIMARIRINYPYAWSSVQILQCTPNWNIDIKSRTIYIQMLFLAPPAHTLHTSCIGQSSSPNHLSKLSVSNTRSFFLSMFRSLSLSTTQPLFHSVTKCIYLTHPPSHPMPSSLSLPSPSHPLALNTCIAYLAPHPLVHTHTRCLSRSLPRDCLTLPSARRATLAQSRSLYPSLV